jgi:hypothetical protein
MKKFLFVLSCVLISVLSGAQDLDKPYDFPVKPGTEQWSKLTSSNEMDSVCVIPDDVVSMLSTKALLLTFLNYPRLVDFYLASDLQTGFNFYSKHFNGLTELLKRSDLNKILLQTYLDLDLTSAKISGYDPKLSLTQIGILELFVAQDAIMGLYEANDKLILLSEAVKKLEQRKKMDQSLFRQRTTALILSRYFYSEDKLLSEKDVNGDDIFILFNAHVIIIDTTVIDKLLFSAKKILKN